MAIPYNAMNKDLLQQQTATVMQKLSTALEQNNTQAAAEAVQAFQDNIVNTIEATFQQYRDVTDMNVLQARGLRALTTEETDFYQKLIEAHKSGAPKQAIENLTAAMPVTIIDRVIEDMKHSHPLLEAITIQNAAGAMRMVTNGVQMASKMGSWGPVTSTIATELSGKIKSADMTAAKYTAYFLLPKDFTRFNFGFAPMWVDQYIRLILSESNAYGLEKTIVKGDGKNQFIGMIMDTSQQTDGAYSAKAAKAITNFGDDYAEVIAELAVDGNDDFRDVPEVLLVVNPKDNIKKIRRHQNAVIYGTGILDLISLTWPTKVVTSAVMDEGEAAVGIAKNYFAAINGGTSGIIEFDDSAQFLEDNRVYTTRLYGNGMPVDNTSFAYLDISGVKAPAMPVEIIGTVETTEPAA